MVMYHTSHPNILNEMCVLHAPTEAAERNAGLNPKPQTPNILNEMCVLQALIEAAERNAGLRQASRVLGEVIEDDDAGWQRERSQVERDRVRLITISPSASPKSRALSLRPGTLFLQFWI